MPFTTAMSAHLARSARYLSTQEASISNDTSITYDYFCNSCGRGFTNESARGRHLELNNHYRMDALAKEASRLENVLQDDEMIVDMEVDDQKMAMLDVSPCSK
jgi:hypothetical protein